MKKQLLIAALIVTACNSFAQTRTSSVLVRHDTSTLKADNCAWIIKSLAKNDPSLKPEIGKSLSQLILEAIEKGKIKAFDANTNAPIPAKKIFTWQMPADSMMTSDEKGNTKLVVVQHKLSSDKIDEIRIYNDLYLDVATGKLQSVIKWLELRAQIYSSLGDLLGHAAFCRVFY